MNLSDKEKILIAAGLTIALLIAPYRFIFEPFLKSIDSLKQRIQSSETKLKQLEELAKEIQSKPAPGEVKKEVPGYYLKGFPEALNYFGEQTRKLGIEIISLNPKNAEKTETGETGKFFALELVTRGKYESFVKFFQAIKESRTVVGFKKIEMKKDEGETSLLKVTSLIQAYQE